MEKIILETLDNDSLLIHDRIDEELENENFFAFTTRFSEVLAPVVGNKKGAAIYTELDPVKTIVNVSKFLIEQINYVLRRR